MSKLTMTSSYVWKFALATAWLRRESDGEVIVVLHMTNGGAWRIEGTQIGYATLDDAIADVDQDLHAWLEWRDRIIKPRPKAKVIDIGTARAARAEAKR